MPEGSDTMKHAAAGFSGCWFGRCPITKAIEAPDCVVMRVNQPSKNGYVVVVWGSYGLHDTAATVHSSITRLVCTFVDDIEVTGPSLTSVLSNQQQDLLLCGVDGTPTPEQQTSKNGHSYKV